MPNKTPKNQPKSAVQKERLDKLLVDRKLISTRARAQAMVLAGKVLVNDEPVTKAGTLVATDAEIRLREPELQYVSRGALKLKSAIEKFQIQAAGKIAIDIGSSTGGFTEILLEEGALKVYAVDVGTNQLAWKLRNDPRVISIENFNAREISPKKIPEPVELLVMDVSFISIKLILPAATSVLKPGSDLAVLYKPQFELGREWIGEGGIVKDQAHAKDAMLETMEWGRSIGLIPMGSIESPITGTDGNHEFLIHWQFQGK